MAVINVLPFESPARVTPEEIRDIAHWASDALLEWMGPALYTDAADTLPGRIVAAVRAAAVRG